MPSPLETLVKILKLEREQGYRDAAVMGGLSAFSENWTKEAHSSARKPEHHMLVNELTDLMRRYEQIEGKEERHHTVSYMLDRIMNRTPPPPEYQVNEAEAAPPPPPDADAAVETSSVEPPPDQATGDDNDSRSERSRARRERAQANAEKREREGGRKRQRTDRTSRQKSKIPDENNRLEFDDEESSSRPSPNRSDLPRRPTLARPPRKPRPPLDPEAATDILRGLHARVETVKGVGPKMAELLNRLGVHTINDLLLYFPRRYDDYTRLLPIRRLEPNMTATVIGTVGQTHVRTGRNNRKDFFMTVDDGSATIDVLFYGRGQFMIRQVRPGQQVVVSGTTSQFRDRIQLTNPEWEMLDSENLHTVGIVPVYGLTEGLTARKLRSLMKDAVDYWAERLPDYMPEATLERADLADLGWAIQNRHFPESFDHLKHAKRRLVFDHLLMLQLTIMANRREWQSVAGPVIEVGDEWLSEFTAAVFPYQLTGAQQRALDDVRRDMARAVPMNRLLQGDVGSGKTAVATTALALAFAAGRQAALMAPTGILAEQHYRGISATLTAMPGEHRPVVALLTSALTTTERESIKRGLADGSIDIVIGTHAVIQEDIEFQDLALAIIDEQHRFGVEQRGALRGKGVNPHLLVMTATPIPRTLALTLYADLDLSIIDELPPGRQPVQTRVLTSEQRKRAHEFIEWQLQQGRQAFVVYPLVEASEKIDAEAAVDAYENLQSVFNEYKVRLLHGRMKAAEKDEIMADFANHAFDVMVTTSVAEVGVNIPNASIIVIEGANRFGLAQLHQFRGRVGRGEHPSYCLLVSDSQVPAAVERLSALEQTNDGFKLAEIDWELRGAGDLIGTRQSGRALIQMASDITPELVELAQREAKTIFIDDPDLTSETYRLLAERVALLQDERADLS